LIVPLPLLEVVAPEADVVLELLLEPHAAIPSAAAIASASAVIALLVIVISFT
jgi:hypothetical protein